MVVVAMLLLIAHVADADVIQARMDENSANKLFFISKFCYSTTGLGALRINTWHVKNDTDLRLLFFDDGLWEQVHHHRLTCQQIRDKVDGLASGQAALREGTNLTFNIAARSRPRYWYAAFSRCAPGPMKFDFEMQFLNGGHWWDQQFSVDQQGLLVMFIVYFTVYAIINLCNFAYIYTRPATTRLFKLFALVALLEGTSKFCYLVHYGLYSNDGIGMSSLASMGEVLNLAVTLGLMGMLVLLGRGWGLSSLKLSHLSANMFILITIFYVLYVAFFLWGDINYDPESTDMPFETAPGVIELVLRIAIWVFFIFGICVLLLDKNVPVAPTRDEEEEDQAAHSQERRHSVEAERDDEERLLRRPRRSRRRQGSEAEADEEEEEEERDDEPRHEERRDVERPDTSSHPPASDHHGASLESADRLEAKKRFYLGLAMLGSLWFLSVPLMVALSESFPVYYRLKAVVALSYTVNFVVIAICSLWLYPERDGLYLINGGGVFLDLSWPTFGARGGEWQEIQSPLLPNSTTPLSSSSLPAVASTTTTLSTAPPTTSYTNEVAPRQPAGGRTAATVPATGNAQVVYDSL